MDKSSVTRTILQKRSWQSAPSNRVCSIHFVDGSATDENPIPTLFLGYESKEKKSRRTLFRKPLKKNVREGDITPVTSTSQKRKYHCKQFLQLFLPQQYNFLRFASFSSRNLYSKGSNRRPPAC